MADNYLLVFHDDKRLVLLGQADWDRQPFDFAAQPEIGELDLASEQQNHHAMQIAAIAGDLYDKLVVFVGSFEKVGHHLKSAQDTHETAGKQLSTGRGNLILRAVSMKALGIDAWKILPNSITRDVDLEPEEVEKKV